MGVEVIVADYSNEQHEREIVLLLDVYATDPMGGGRRLDKEVKDKLVSRLSRVPKAFSLIAYSNGIPVGLANCFISFSTFSCKPLVNIHDFVVLQRYRGQGISQKMLGKIEEIAKSEGCCKVTLEVLSKNEAAKSAYRKFGFTDYELDPNAGHALFWQKELP